MAVAVLVVSALLLASGWEPLFAAPVREGRYLILVPHALVVAFGLVCFAFPLLTLIRSLVYLYAPVERLLARGRHYAHRPARVLPPREWPAVTIQIPVHTENFGRVIRPTIHRALRAAQGRANIVIYDDGLLVLAGDDLPGLEARVARKLETGEPLTDDETEVSARLEFYRAHSRSLGF